MAINDDTNSNSSQRAHKAAPRQPASSFAEFKTRNPRHVPMNAYLTQVLETLTDSLVEVPGHALQLLNVDHENASEARMSAVVLCLADKGEHPRVVYYGLLVEQSPCVLPDTQETMSGKTYPVMHPSHEAIDNGLIGEIQKRVKAKFPEHSLVELNLMQVLPWGIDKNKMDQVMNEMMHSVMTILESVTNNSPPMKLIQLRNEETIQIAISQEAEADLLYGLLPVRQDITIVTTAVSNRGRRSVFKRTPISTVAGYLDLHWATAAPKSPEGPNFMGQFVMTKMNNALVSNTSAQLFALASALALSKDNAWQRSWFTDPERISLSPSRRWLQDHREDIRPDLSFALDVSVAGSDTVYNEVFAAAASGYSNAIEEIFHAASELTDNAFSCSTGAPPVITDNNIILLGHYHDKHGIKKDLRSIDGLSLLDTTSDDAHLYLADTYYDQSQPLLMRLAKRKAIFEEYVSNGSLKVTGYARRVTFTGEFLTSLSHALAQMGLSMEIKHTPDLEIGVQHTGAPYLDKTAFTLNSNVFSPRQNCYSNHHFDFSNSRSRYN